MKISPWLDRGFMNIESSNNVAENKELFPYNQAGIDFRLPELTILSFSKKLRGFFSKIASPRGPDGPLIPDNSTPLFLISKLSAMK